MAIPKKRRIDDSPHVSPHLGLTLGDDVLPEQELSVTEVAQHLDMGCVKLSRVLNGRAAISPEMILHIEAWLSVERGGGARLWLAEQNDKRPSRVAIQTAVQSRADAGSARADEIITGQRASSPDGVKSGNLHCLSGALFYEI